ncbi:MAG: DHH family phosphoesterase [Nitrososphaerales archaeon]|nr:DHH family phosphoesterase [Nitrososphaerales archaeon]
MKKLVVERRNHKITKRYQRAPSKFPFLKPKRLNRAIVICHRHADVDAYCSAYGVTNILNKIKKGVQVEVVAPEGLNLPARRVAEKYPVQQNEKIDFDNIDLAVVVDTGHLALLGEYAEPFKNAKCLKVFLDHHPLNNTITDIADYVFTNEMATSTSELVTEIFSTLKLTISKDVAQVLLTGIIFDSQHLRLADHNTIKIVSKLCERGASIRDSMEIGGMSRDRSERIARLKGIQRLSLFTLGDWVVGLTKIGSHQASVARAMIDLGADLAIAVGEDAGRSRCCLRASHSFHKITGIHLGINIAQIIAENMGGVGGGHPTASSFTLNTSPEKLVNSVFRIVENSLDIKKKSLK